MSRRGRPSKHGAEQEVEPERKRLCILHKAKVPHDAPFTFLADLGAALTHQPLQYLHTERYEVEGETWIFQPATGYLQPDTRPDNSRMWIPQTVLLLLYK